MTNDTITLYRLLVPVALEAWTMTRKVSASRQMNLSAVVGLCLLVGGIILRYAILAAGANLAGTL